MSKELKKEQNTTPEIDDNKLEEVVGGVDDGMGGEYITLRQPTSEDLLNNEKNSQLTTEQLPHYMR